MWRLTRSVAKKRPPPSALVAKRSETIARPTEDGRHADRVSSASEARRA